MKPLTEKSKQEIEQLLGIVTGWFARHPTVIKFVEGANSSIVEIHPHPEDIGSLIGREGCVVRSLRLLFSAYSSRIAHELHPQIIESGERVEKSEPRRHRHRRNEE
jgi:predicted RNA-binding protein YlqC (UPF0109 family)